LEGTNNYKTRVKFLAPNERTRDQNNKDSSIQHKHPKLLAPNKRTRELEVSTQNFHALRRTTKVKL
jgi:hypothetical protein